MSDTLYRKYRPKKFTELVGQSAVVASLMRIIEKKSAQSYLFSGPSGCGKTTLARLTAARLGASDDLGLTEVDAATNSGIDAMRAIQDMTTYKAFGKSTARAIIVDECHGLSKQAWDSLLKAIEEPSPNVYWFLCTTMLEKVPKTAKTRCAAFQLKEVNDKDLDKLLGGVIEAEDIEIGDDVLDLVIREAGGSPRQALMNLAVCQGLTSKKEAAELLRTQASSDKTIELCRFLVRGGSWMKAMGILAEMEDVNPESVRIITCNYLASCIKGARNDRDVCRYLSMLENFATPYNSSERMAPLYISLGRCIFSEGD